LILTSYLALSSCEIGKRGTPILQQELTGLIG